jgi:hypothetical protein
MAPLKPRLTLQKDISVSGRRLAIASSGPVEEMIATILVGAKSATEFWYYIWFQDLTTHAADYAVINNKPRPNWNIFGKETYSSMNLYYPDGVTVDAIAPRDNRTELVVFAQKDQADVFFARFTIQTLNTAYRHQFLLKYKGKAPQSYLEKKIFGKLIAAGNTPGSVDSIVW